MKHVKGLLILIGLVAFIHLLAWLIKGDAVEVAVWGIIAYMVASEVE